MADRMRGRMALVAALVLVLDGASFVLTLTRRASARGRRGLTDSGVLPDSAADTESDDDGACFASRPGLPRRCPDGRGRAGRDVVRLGPPHGSRFARHRSVPTGELS